MSGFKLTVLVDNIAADDLLAEHGLAFWIEYRGRKILFDTGRGHVLGANTASLSITLEETEYVVLSHGHNDHTGGLGSVLDRADAEKVFAHPASLEPKFSRKSDGTVEEAGMPADTSRKLRSLPGLVEVDKPATVCEGFHLTGPVPRETDFEDTGGDFHLDRECRRPDNVQDDQSAYCETSVGPVVVLGCAHSGVINTLNRVRQLTGGRKIHTLIGGMHLCSADERRMRLTVEELGRMGLERIIPTHCTGFEAMARLYNELTIEVRPGRAGMVIEA